jgi:hypothetical protein
MVRRALKWLLPALVAVEAFLVWSGRLSLGEAVVVLVIFEALLIPLSLGALFLAARRYRRERAAGIDSWAAFEGGLSLVLPRPVAKLVVNELRMSVCLARWVTRRTALKEGEFGYHKKSAMGMLLLVVVLTAPLEVLLFEILVPWAWLRWLLLVASVYAVFWLFAFYASLVTLPHRLEGDGLRLRYGLFAEVLVPYDEISGIERHKLRDAAEGLQLSPDECTASLAVGGETDLTLRLKAPLVVRSFLKETVPVGVIHLAADDPGGLARALVSQLREPTVTASPGRGTGG